MSLKKDWTFAHFLAYIFKISFWLILASVIIQSTVPLITTISNDKSFVTGYPIPIRMDVPAFNHFRTIDTDEVAITINNSVSGTMLMEANLSENLYAFLFYNGVIYLRWAAILIALFFGERLFKNIATGDHFNVKNPKYLFIVGLTLVIASIAYSLLYFVPLPLINEMKQPDFVTIKSIMMADNNFMLVGIACIVFSYVFKEGTRIYEEQKLTV